MIRDFTGIFITILCCLGYIYAADLFCKKYLEISQTREILFVVLNFSGWVLLNIVNQLCFGIYGFLVLLNHVLFMGLVFLLFRGGRDGKVLAASILITVHTLAGNFCGSLLSCLVLFWRHAMLNIAEPVLSERESDLIGGISLVMVIWAVRWMSKHFQSVFYYLKGKWNIILVIPLLTTAAVTDAANWGACYGILVRSGGNMGLYYDQILSHTGFCVMTFLFMIAAGGYLFGINRIYMEQKKSEQYHSRITAYKTMEEQYCRWERLRHDLKNHILALMGLVENEEWEKMKEYLSNMADGADLKIDREITGNRVVDILLYQKRQSAEERNIIWECDVQVPPICCLNEFDLCVLFGNILDNAVEACEKLQREESHCSTPPFINIRAEMVKKCYLLEVRNSVGVTDNYKAGLASQNSRGTDRINVSEPVQIIDRGNRKNQEGHGIGLLNVRDVVDKYNGVMSIEVRDGVFVISILIPSGNAAHDIKQVV